MKRLPTMIGLLLICYLPIIVSCTSSKIDTRAPLGPATVQCDPMVRPDCVSVSKAFVKEHADLFDEVIRARATIKMYQEKQ